ncbi:MAG: amidohydrolase [Collinsella stercoris]|uniref:amidohydrolase n=1 Tax=Collinsella stercoris TaxID=147206 RepID=UPI00399516E7
MGFGHVDYIVTSRRIFTSAVGDDAARSLAFAVAGDRIELIGAPADVIAACPPDTPVLDFGDAFICPGFHDAHLHFFHTALGASPYLLMHMGESEAELVERTVEFAKNLPEHAWVVTQGWRDYRWDPPVPPTKHSLDEAFPTRPCVMYSGDGHTLWMNSRALEALGVTRDSVPPQGGSYDHNENGELTGIVREAAAMELLPRCLAWLTESDIARAYEEQMTRMAEQGITSICDMALMPHPGCDFIRDDVYEALARAGKLTLRAHMYPTLLDDQSRLEALQARYATGEFPLLRAPGFKQFFDGVSSQHTAWLTDPYTNAHTPGDCGRPTVPAGRMRKLVLAAAERGHSVRIHTIGDRAIHEALDIFGEAQAWYGAPMQGRNTLEHLENLLPQDIDRLSELGVLASSQPGHITLDPGGPERDLGEERSRVMWPFATYAARGVEQAFGTDSPITAVTSMDVLYCAVTRQDPFTHEPAGGWLPAERISAAEALRIYTAGSAAAAGREHELGQIAPGYLADFVVLDRDITACDASEIQGAKVQATYLAGKRVFERA